MSVTDDYGNKDAGDASSGNVSNAACGDQGAWPVEDLPL